MRVLCARVRAPWLGTAAALAGGTFAAVNASLWQAAAFLPVIVLAAALDERRSR